MTAGTNTSWHSPAKAAGFAPPALSANYKALPPTRSTMFCCRSIIAATFSLYPAFSDLLSIAIAAS